MTLLTEERFEHILTEKLKPLVTETFVRTRFEGLQARLDFIQTEIAEFKREVKAFHKRVKDDDSVFTKELIKLRSRMTTCTTIANSEALAKFLVPATSPQEPSLAVNQRVVSSNSVRGAKETLYPPEQVHQQIMRETKCALADSRR